MARGKKTGGRRKGSTNKLASFKEAVLRVYGSLGGDEAFHAWAEEHRTEFYSKVAPRLIPTEVAGAGTTPLPLRIELTHGPETPPHAK